MWVRVPSLAPTNTLNVVLTGSMIKIGMKLIRDFLASRIPKYELMFTDNQDEIDGLLRAKLHEEIQELEQSGFTDPEEYADVLEVLETIAARQGVSMAKILETKRDKFLDKGGFQTGLIWTGNKNPISE